MTARLVFITGSRAGSAHDLGSGTATVGRSPDCTVAFGSGEVLVSGHHASISYHEGRYVIRDQGSRNGTFVNGKRIEEGTLKDHDLIQFGAGGPGARFLADVDPCATPTLEQREMAAAFEILHQTMPDAEREEVWQAASNDPEKMAEELAKRRPVGQRERPTTRPLRETIAPRVKLSTDCKTKTYVMAHISLYFGCGSGWAASGCGR